MPSFKEEIGTEIPCCIDANIDANEVHVYCNTLDDAKKVGRTITGLFQEETVDIEDLNSESLTLEKKVMEWKKEFSEMLDIEVTAKYIHMCGLRQIVEQILPKLKSFIQQNSRASSSTLNVKDEFDQAKDEHDDAALEGEIWFEKEEEVQCLKAKDFEKKIEEIKDRYQCSVNIKMENAYPLMKKQSKKWTWLFQSGQKVVLENAELKDVEANGSKCLISFLPETKQTIPAFLQNDIKMSIRCKRIFKGMYDHLVHVKIRTNKTSVFVNTDEPSRETIAIRIDKKSFTDEKVQVLVNTVGRDLNLKRGHVSNSILSAAGNEIQKEANAKFPNGLFRGQLLVTDAYNLRGKGILKAFFQEEKKYLNNPCQTPTAKLFSICPTGYFHGHFQCVDVVQMWTRPSALPWQIKPTAVQTAELVI
uniref:Uncharacterized protein n=1 Tax=Magallana gigas TaxID=29159 RepID=K1PE64_MAGGI